MNEHVRRVKCSRSKKLGHNRATCEAPIEG